MQEVCCYHIVVAGQVEEQNFNATSPIWIQLEQIGLTATRLTAFTDQSGLIGLLRFLHSRGFVLRSVTRSETVVV